MKSARLYGGFCSQCAKFTRTLEAAEAAILRGGEEQALNQWLDAGIIHFVGDSGSGLICLESVLEAVANSVALTVETSVTSDGGLRLAYPESLSRRT